MEHLQPCWDCTRGDRFSSEMVRRTASSYMGWLSSSMSRSNRSFCGMNRLALRSSSVSVTILREPEEEEEFLDRILNI